MTTEGMGETIVAGTEDLTPALEPNSPGNRPVLRDPQAIATPLALKTNPRARILTNGLEPVVLERYRRLRTKLLQDDVGGSIRSVMITSAEPEEGKTLTALNLALSFSLLPGFRVVLVDGDLRRASVGTWLGAEGGPGLSNMLDGSARLEDVLRKPGDLPIHVVLAGDAKAPPAESLQPRHMRAHMTQLREYFDLIVIDTPPVNLIADASLIAQSCDGVLLVARAFATKRKSLERAIQDLEGHRILGAVLNAGSDHRDYRRYSNYY